MAFFGEFVLSPMTVGALIESPPKVAKLLCDNIGLESAMAVAEYGPGTGPVTREILNRLPKQAKFFAIEKSPNLARLFRARNPDVKLYEGSAELIRDYCRREGIEKLDSVVTSIPWILLPRPVQERMLDETITMLRPGSRMSFLTYRKESMGIVRRFVDLTKERFAAVEGPFPVRVRLSTCNIYRCTTPK